MAQDLQWIGRLAGYRVPHSFAFFADERVFLAICSVSCRVRHSFAFFADEWVFLAI